MHAVVRVIFHAIYVYCIMHKKGDRENSCMMITIPVFLYYIYIIIIRGLANSRVVVVHRCVLYYEYAIFCLYTLTIREREILKAKQSKVK